MIVEVLYGFRWDIYLPKGHGDGVIRSLSQEVPIEPVLIQNPVPPV